MRKIITIFLILISFVPGLSQERPAAYRAYTDKYPEGSVLNHYDSLLLMNIPEKVMPDELRADPLPPIVDNSELPYLRQVFEQVAPSCGQAAMVGYNFTYEMAYLRDQPALFPQTQYPTHFVYNFQNGGNAWYGVSYFHSIEILRLCGTMNSADYGDYFDDGRRWINGYDMYYNGMYNRVKGVYSINTSTTEGMLSLKHWLYDHMGEGNYGGVASYYANVPWNANFLNDSTPEGGKHVMTAWFPAATHAMTIVGYNDSIRWDYNNDGQYTNTIDLNEDGMLDPRDWEIGGVKFVNSHGLGAQDSGFCYMMYKCLAETFENGGVWNQSVHILDIDENYTPLMTYKISLKHNYREKVKILAGVSTDTTDITPEWLMDFPIIDYQGADHYMQGHDTTEYLKTLEFGLDIRPLLSHLQPGQAAKFFFVVDENDPYLAGEGEITSFSLLDYTSEGLEIVSSQTPLSLDNNSRTMVSVIYTPHFDIVEITTDALPVFAINEPYTHQMQAEGGSPPYVWDAVYKYRIDQSTETFPAVQDNQVLFTADTDTIVAVPLGFSFPYYGKIYDTLYMHINGHLQFDRAQLPWPYMMEPVLHFRSNRMITPMTNQSFTIVIADDDGGWVDLNDSSATFRWKLSWMNNPGTTEFNFAVKIFQNGNIDFIYGNSTLEDIPWLGGISEGNKADYIQSPGSGSDKIEAGDKTSFFHHPLPQQLDLSENGLITALLNSDDFIYDLTFRASDQSGLSSVKTLQFSSGPFLDFTVNAGGDNRIEYGDTVSLDLEIRNGGTDTLWNSMLELSTGDPFIEMLDPDCSPGVIFPGQIVTVTGAVSFVVSIEVPDLHDLCFNIDFTSEEKVWAAELLLKANAPDLKIKKFFIDDDDGRLDPGDTAPLMVTYQNSGHASIDNVSAELFSLTPDVQIMEDPLQIYGTIGKGASVTQSYLLHADDSAPNGLISHLVLNAGSQQGIERQDSLNIKIGKTPVLVIDMDPNQHSGPVILSMLNELNVPAEYEYTVPPYIGDNQSIFVCLGYQNSNHILTLGEGQKLADFLDEGGRIYMEGNKTWRDDPGTPIQPKFSLNTVDMVGVYDTINGYDGTFTQGFSLENNATTPFSFYYLEPIPPAYSILQDNNTLYPCAIAYEAGIYRTIGALFELGTMSGISPHSTRDLLEEYLEFFGVVVNPIGVEELGGWEAGELGSLEVWPNPAGSQLTVDSRQLTVGSRQSAVNCMIFDLFGRNLIFEDVSSFPYTIDISGFSPGMYILRIVGEDGVLGSVRFIKLIE